MLSSRSALALATVTAACFLAPSLAQATDFCVNDPVCAQQGGDPSYSNLQDALAMANMTPAADRIFVGPGTYTAPSTTGFVATWFPTEIIGAGRDQTTLTGPANTSPVLYLGNTSSAVSNLRIAIPVANDGLLKGGLELSGGSAKSIAITSDNPLASLRYGAAVSGGTMIENSSVTLPVNGPSTAIQAGVDTQISNVDITANQGIEATGANVKVDRARITAGGAGVFAKTLNARVSNSVVHLPSSGTALLAKDGFTQTDVTLAAHNVTAVGDTGEAYGVRSESTNGHTVGVTVDSTVIRGMKSSLIRGAAGAGSASIAMITSDYDPGTVVSNGPGSVFNGAGNINADPLFTSATDYHPIAGSPLVDAGDPSPSSDTLDLDGKPRVVNNRRDIGAYELQPAPPAPTGGDAAPASGDTAAEAVGATSVPTGAAADSNSAAAPAAKDTVAPVLTGLRIAPQRFTVRRGSAIRFKLSETATVTIVLNRRAARGSRLTKIVTFRRSQIEGVRNIPLGKRFAGARLRPGRYVVVVTATDAAGNRSRAYRLSFRVVRR